MDRQFLILVRHFFTRFFEVASTDSEVGTYLRIVQLLAILSLPGLMISFFLIPDHPPGSLIMAAAQTEAERMWLRVGDRYAFVVYAMTAMGLLMAFKWDALFPDRPDYLILTPLPIRARRWFAAKAVAVSGFLLLFVIAINIFSLLIIPAILARHSGSDGGRAFAQAFVAHAYGTIGGSIFAAFFFAALQGLLINILPATTFRRVSPLIQTISIFVLLTLLLITPLAKESIPAFATARSHILDYYPVMWFLGLYETHLPDGSLMPQSTHWASTALTAAGVVFAIFILSYWVGYYRYSRRILESPESNETLLQPAKAHVTEFIDRLFLRNAIERGAFHFIEQISTRSSEHRILTALYTAMGAALALSSLFAINPDSDASFPFRLSSTGSLEASLTLMFVWIGGLRSTFSVPYELNSNWIFQLCGTTNSAGFMRATHKWIFLYRIAPLLLIMSVFEFSCFPAATAFWHLTFDLFVAALLVETFFVNFNRVPFTCRFSSGKLQLVLIAAAYLYGFTTYLQIAGGLKGFVTATSALDLGRSGRMIVAACVAATLLAVIRTCRSTAPITYDDAESVILDISSDGGYWSGTRPESHRAKPPSVRSLLLVALVLTAIAVPIGIIFEQAGETLDRRAFPQVGQSFDVGGRTLNIFCLGNGGPTVILESDVAVAGYSWLIAQRAISRFARVCWYDRAGYGWSDPGPFPNHSDSIARDLHQLLMAAAISPPYVLVGHGIGAFHVRVYNGLYPHDAAGMVLVDPLNEDTTIRVHNHDETLRPAVIELSKTLGFIGVLRLIAPGPGTTPPGWSAGEWRAAMAMAAQERSSPYPRGSPLDKRRASENRGRPSRPSFNSTFRRKACSLVSRPKRRS